MDTQTEPPRVTRKEKRAQTNHLLLDAARASFIEHGYDHTTLRNLAKRAGRSTGSYFNWHADKLEALAEVLNHDLPAELATLTAAAAEPTQHGSALLAVLGADYEYWRSRPGLCQAWWSRHCARDEIIVAYTEAAKLQIMAVLHEVLKASNVRMPYARAEILWSVHVEWLQRISGEAGENHTYTEEMYRKSSLVLFE